MGLPDASVGLQRGALEIDHRVVVPPLVEERAQRPLASLFLTELFGPPALGAPSLGEEVQRVVDGVEASTTSNAPVGEAHGEGVGFGAVSSRVGPPLDAVRESIATHDVERGGSGRRDAPRTNRLPGGTPRDPGSGVGIARRSSEPLGASGGPLISRPRHQEAASCASTRIPQVRLAVSSPRLMARRTEWAPAAIRSATSAHVRTVYGGRSSKGVGTRSSARSTQRKSRRRDISRHGFPLCSDSYWGADAPQNAPETPHKAQSWPISGAAENQKTLP
jgi:hypothetical protein